ncbi:sensor histidine kinase [Paractinoplanes globisporus]|uniref:histidine kinase n=1 Tax=Paractinoplanes globisporus TaxID=113565 RepID=A0ABW6WKG4_9ACTN|nr:histidine kinase [Actinoplanes globisporus]
MTSEIRQARLLDAGLAALLLAAMVAERIVSGHPAGIPLSVIIAGALYFRRTWPLASYLAGSAALSAEALFVQPSAISPYANLIGIYSLGLYATRNRALVGPPAILIGTVAYFWGETDILVPAGVLFSWLLAWGIGFGAARRREERDAARQSLQRQVADDERNRIAREVHDLIGHTVNVMLVQAGAARRVLDTDPAQSRELLIGLETAGRQALDELDQVLGLLRDAQPGLAELPSLTERLGQAGVRVDTTIEPGELSHTVDRSAYRIVQEALTNAVKHGRATTASVRVRRDGSELHIEVDDDGAGVPEGYSAGRGLLGITERATMLGGHVTHGPGPAGGFRVRAKLPAR